MILRVDNLSTSYGTTPILRNVSFEVEDERIIGLIGRNGAGKTTLLKTIMGHLPLESGSIMYNEENISDLNPDQRAKKGIGYIPQGREVFPGLTCEENLRIGKLINKGESNKLEKEVFEYFPRLEERRNQKAGSMSGGEQQMLAIGRAIIGNPNLLLLDEPSEGIQPTIVQEIIEKMKKIGEEQNISILFVEQNLKVIQEMADSCYVVENGTITDELSQSDLSHRGRIETYLAL